MDFATVHFVCDHMVVTVQVTQPDMDDNDYIASIADEIVCNAYGFSPAKLAYDVEVDY